MTVVGTITPSGPLDLKAFRDGLGITQEQLARGLGCSASTVSKWESRGEPPKDPLVLSRAYGAVDTYYRWMEFAQRVRQTGDGDDDE